jgi:hypothetical protein
MAAAATHLSSQPLLQNCLKLIQAVLPKGKPPSDASPFVILAQLESIVETETHAQGQRLASPANGRGERIPLSPFGIGRSGIRGVLERSVNMADDSFGNAQVVPALVHVPRRINANIVAIFVCAGDIPFPMLTRMAWPRNSDFGRSPPPDHCMIMRPLACSDNCAFMATVSSTGIMDKTTRPALITPAFKAMPSQPIHQMVVVGALRNQSTVRNRQLGEVSMVPAPF